MKRLYKNITTLYVLTVYLIASAFGNIFPQSFGFPLEDKQLINYAKVSGFISSNFISRNATLGSLNKSLTAFKGNSDFSQSSNTQIFQSNFFSFDDLALDSSFYWSELGVNHTLKVKELPIRLSIRIRSNNGEILFDRSSFGVGVDFEKYKQNVVSDYWEKESIWEKILEDDFFNLSSLEEKIVLQEILFTFYQQVVTSPVYKDKVEKYETRLDSLKTNILFSEIEEVSALGDTIKLIEERYEFYKNAIQKERYLNILEVRKKIDSIAISLNQITSPQDRIESLSGKAKSKLSKVSRIMEKLEFGYFHLDQEDFLSTSLPVNGVNTKFTFGNIYGQISFGKQAFTGFFQPSFGVHYLDDQLANNILLSKVGWKDKTKNRSINFSVLRVRDFNQSNSDNARSLNGTNWVYGFSNLLHLTNSLGLKISLFQSQFIQGISPSMTGSSRSMDNMATSIKLVYQPEVNLELAGGYYRSGPTYFSLANPFQLSNTEGLEFEVKSKLFKSKLVFDFLLKAGQEIQENIDGGDWLRYQMRGMIAYHIARNSQLRINFFPNVYRLQNAGESINNRQGILIGEFQNIQKIRKKTELITQIRISNFAQGLFLQDTAQYFNQLLGELATTFRFNQKWSWQNNILIGLDNDLKRFNLSLNYGNNKFSCGLSVFKGTISQFIKGQFGYSGQMAWQFLAKGRISIRLSNIRNNNLEETLNNPQSRWNAQTSVTALLN